jgi:hypothetical protein
MTRIAATLEEQDAVARALTAERQQRAELERALAVAKQDRDAALAAAREADAARRQAELKVLPPNPTMRPAYVDARDVRKTRTRAAGRSRKPFWQES